MPATLSSEAWKEDDDVFGRRFGSFPVDAGKAPGGEPVAGCLAEEEFLGHVDLPHDQGGEPALVEEDFWNLWVPSVDRRGVAVPEVDEVAQGPTDVVFAESSSRPRGRMHLCWPRAMVLRAFQSRVSRASIVKSCRSALGLNPFAPGLACVLTRWRDLRPHGTGRRSVRRLPRGPALLPGTTELFLQPLSERSPARHRPCERLLRSPGRRTS